ncbi:HD domain-containing protein [Phycisphaeraceae bacterium D3-23]
MQANIATTDVLDAIKQQYLLDWQGVHGVRHWSRVMQNGLRIAEDNGADPIVVRLFALYHDACRTNDGHDPGHGARGAGLAQTHHGEHFTVTDDRLDLLIHACRHHTDGMTSDDPTVAACWDADRLDLPRVCVYPRPEFLSSATAKQHDTMRWAAEHATANTHADCLPTG